MLYVAPDDDRRAGPPAVRLPVVLVLGAVAVCVVLGLVALSLGAPVALRRPPPDRTPPPSPVAPSEAVTTTAPVTTQPVARRPVNVAAGAAVSADLTAPDNVDGGGERVSYAAANLVDGDPATTWRATGDARGTSLRLRFPVPRVVTVVGLVNGYAKRDPASGDDRYLEERRVTAVTWTFDDGTTYAQVLDDGVRAVQRLAVDPVRTSGVTVRIDVTTAPGDADRDYTAISEVEVMGT
jgi:hypothetical protein